MPRSTGLPCASASPPAPLAALHATRTQTVFGVGTERARLMIIGEAPARTRTPG